jgi:hypothetical protein
VGRVRAWGRPQAILVFHRVPVARPSQPTRGGCCDPPGGAVGVPGGAVRRVPCYRSGACARLARTRTRAHRHGWWVAATARPGGGRPGGAHRHGGGASARPPSSPPVLAALPPLLRRGARRGRPAAMPRLPCDGTAASRRLGASRSCLAPYRTAATAPRPPTAATYRGARSGACGGAHRPALILLPFRPLDGALPAPVVLWKVPRRRLGWFTAAPSIVPSIVCLPGWTKVRLVPH